MWVWIPFTLLSFFKKSPFPTISSSLRFWYLLSPPRHSHANCPGLLMVSSFMNLFSKNLSILTDKLSSYRIIWRIIYWRAEEGAGRIHQQVCKAKEIRDEKEFQKISPLAFLLLSSYSLCIDVGSVAIPWRRTRSHCTCFYKHRRSTKTMCQGKCARENERFVLVSGSFIYLLVQRGVRHPIPHPPLLPCLNWSRQWLFMLLKIKLGERLLCNPPSQHTHTTSEDGQTYCVF